MTHPRHSIPEKRKLHWVSEDIEDQEVIDERNSRRREARDISRQYLARKHEAESRSDYFTFLRGRGLSGPRATLAAYGDMPAVKKGRKKPLGIGATRKAKKNYGATPAFNKALVAAVKKVENRQQETVYSQSGFYMNTNSTTLTTTGFSLSGLNQSAAYASATTTTRLTLTNNVFYFPLSALAQVGNSSTPGYRKGQRINPVGFRISIQHYQGLATVGATYTWMLIRNKGQTLTAVGTTSGITIPGINQVSAMALFVPLIQGPLAGAGGPNGSTPNGDFVSAMRFNYADWQKVKSGSWTMGPILQRENSSQPSAPNSANAQTAAKQIKAYVPIKDSYWEYPLPTAISGIKGGDYFFVIYREGYQDPNINSDAIIGQVELSFKDP